MWKEYRDAYSGKESKHISIDLSKVATFTEWVDEITVVYVNEQRHHIRRTYDEFKKDMIDAGYYLSN